MKRVWRTLLVYVISLDFGAMLIVCFALGYVLPDRISSAFAKDIYGVGISVLSIVFAVFFAALAIIMTSSDDAFVLWLEEKGHYRGLVGLFKTTLAILFGALLSALILYLSTARYVMGCDPKAEQSRWWLIGFSGLFVYALIAAAMSSLDAIKYAEHRATYVHLANRDNNNAEENIRQPNKP